MSKVITKDQIVETIANMTAMEIVELSDMLKEKFGVSYTDLVSQAAPVASVEKEEVSESKEEEEQFKVVLEKLNDAQKMKLIVAIKDALGLKRVQEAAEKVNPEKLPSVLKENVSKEEGEKLRDKLASLGATVVIQKQ